MLSKQIVTVALGIAMILSMAACSKTQNSTTVSSEASVPAVSSEPDSTTSPEKAPEKTAEITKPITLIVPWNAGGGTDIMARYLQPIFKNELGIDLTIKNVEGGGSAVGLTEVIASKPDGYTLGLASSSYLALVAQGRMDAGIDKTTNIVTVSEDPIILVAKANGKYADAKAFVDAAKANPGKVSIGVPGSNNVNQAFAALLGRGADTEFNFLPFDGASRVSADIIGGHIDAGVVKPSEAITQIQSGDLIALGVFSNNRLTLLPETPTFAEVGYDVFSLGQITQMSYIIGPAGMDPEMQKTLAELFQKALQSNDFQKFADERVFVCSPIIGDELDSYINDIYAGMEKVSTEIFS
ncbi:tripartite tricarboxylate transporter substrate binding protein [Marasmitruncus massiliensis]|uniref:tripartite tricarboxylate transporter substrate binding protein n=1 Tax=Marasmitruncus massiliensis TaxID=1944642 RepID=UPI0015E12E4D|nr:tripartite tricarboxylate transporter substrate binding protein [Marasmitruncus massiliensis]